MHHIFYFNDILVGTIPAPYTIQGIKTTYAIIIGSKTVQHTDINWSKRILGKEALAQIKTKIKNAVLIAKFNGEEEIYKIISYIIVLLILNNKSRILIINSKGIILK